MTRPLSDTDFTSQITEDRTWRLKEISDLKSASIKADQGLRRVLLRSLVTICYAHWEGYVRFAARRYLDHVALRKFQYSELDRQFLRNYFLPRLAALSTTKTGLKDRCNLVDEILGSADRRFSRINEDLVNTKSNLNFDVFSDICLICGVPADAFKDQSTFIDIVLLKRRNSIAHGEESYVELDDLDELANQTVSLMRTFGDALENLVYSKSYKSA
jgi:hypothetical protein